jgi:hypothetical protein
MLLIILLILSLLCNDLSVSRLYNIDARIIMNLEQLVEWELAGGSEVLGENLPQWHFLHHKSHMTRPRIESGPPSWEAGY